ncbi:zinc finger CCCH domain-containing protein 17-like isoform X4 [Diospyros lotus]|uniref:zinc finger CCCH domain-containing protein 17-like isoform X3 n=1 Tax=Diospyros lotus TaxID=55363 RepID=UPI002254C548|nr:zinc finger CCCH domain-containing protein 17-like isoform X3 [Diospyros lotus]XP_052177808.1 zinc finger CCCH domain-containing protein 17-like isoform X4 [Diospyros lotus]
MDAVGYRLQGDLFLSLINCISLCAYSMAIVAVRVSERRQGSGFRRQSRGGLVNVICAAFWLEGRCCRHPCKFLHAETKSVTSRQPKQFQDYKSRTWKRTPDNSSIVKNSSVLSSAEDGSEHSNGTERVQDKVCQYWLPGKCVHGEVCKFLHSWSYGNGFSMITKLEGHCKAVMGIVLPSGSNKLYTGCKDKTIRVWDYNTGQVWNTQTCNELTLTGPVGQVHAMATTDDMLFAAAQDGTILAWKFRSENEHPELIASLKVHSCAVISLAIGANMLYSGSMDNTIRVWDLNTLLCVQTLQGHTGSVMSVLCWDKYLLSCSLDGTIKAWGATKAGDIEMIYSHKEHGPNLFCFAHATTTVSACMTCQRSLKGAGSLHGEKLGQFRLAQQAQASSSLGMQRGNSSVEIGYAERELKKKTLSSCMR